MDTCIIYLTKTCVDPIPNADLFLINDRDTRSHAKAMATGIRVIAGPLMLEVIEAPMHSVERLLDEASESKHWKEPEILLTIPIEKHAFQSWVMVNAAPVQDVPSVVNALQTLAAQVIEDPLQLHQAIKQMVLCFQQPRSNAA